MRTVFVIEWGNGNVDVFADLEEALAYYDGASFDMLEAVTGGSAVNPLCICRGTTEWSDRALQWLAEASKGLVWG